MNFSRFAVILLLLAGWTQAQPTEQIDWWVLDSQEVVFADRSIVFRRVAPPVLHPMLIAPTAETDGLTDTSPSPVEKPTKVLFLAASSAAEVTELRWQEEQGEVVARSTIDAGILPGVFEFETAQTHFLFFALAHDQNLPPADASIVSLSSYLLLSDPCGDAEASANATMEALHAYYDANRQRLVQERAARVEMESNSAPEPVAGTDSVHSKSTVITFFPIRSAAPDAAARFNPNAAQTP